MPGLAADSKEEDPKEPLSIGYLGFIAFAGVVTLLFAYTVLRHSKSTIFSIVAETRVFSVRPVCGAKILWDLPAGEVDGLTLRDGRAPPKAKSVSLGFGDDAVAHVAMGDDGRVMIRVRPLQPGTEAKSIFALRDAQPLARDRDGYAFRTAGQVVGEGRALTLRLVGRVVIGDSLPEGGGWKKSSAAILGRGHLSGHDEALVTGERLTLINEPIDPGAVVDTHPRMNSTEADGRRLIDIAASQADCASAEMGGAPAEGFARGAKDGALEVVVYRRGQSIGIAPLGKPGMEISVTKWRSWIASPIFQTAVAIAGVLLFLLQVLTANRRWLFRRSKLAPRRWRPLRKRP